MKQVVPDKSTGKFDKGRLKALYEQLAPAYTAALQDLQQSIRHLLEQHDLTPTIKYRVKRFDAYFSKLNRLTADQHILAKSSILSDFLGIRIICPFLADIDTVEQLLIDQFEVVEVERKANQHSFREFGYDSLHLLIDHATPGIETPMPGTHPVCEIQLRTILQDAWAEVEHELVYKSDIELPNESIRRKLASLNATLTLSDLIFQEIRDFQQELRQRRYKRRESLQRGWQPELQRTPEPFPSLLPTSSLRLGPVPKTLASELEKLMLSALEAHSNQEFQTAIELYGKLLGLKLQKRIRALVYNHRGLAHFAMGETRLAIKDFSMALNFDPENIRGYTNRGLCHRTLQQFDQALADFDRALQLDCECVESYFGRAQCYCEMGLYDQALSDCNEVLQRNPEHQPVQHLCKLIRRAMLREA